MGWADTMQGKILTGTFFGKDHWVTKALMEGSIKMALKEVDYSDLHTQYPLQKQLAYVQCTWRRCSLR
jgi:hypothetical protein